MKNYFFIFLLVLGEFIFASDLTITVSDIRLSQDPDGGYHLFIKQKEGVNSVLLTETTKNSDNTVANYAYRAKEWNSINGDEKRMLNGEFLVSESAKYSLIDSTSEPDSVLGMAFHIYIPQEMEFGYPWTRNGVEVIKKGTFINIRTFEKQYADYEGNYLDNPFMFNFETRIEQKKNEKKEEKVVLYDDYSPKAADAFESIAKNNKGTVTYSRGPETLINDIMDSFKQLDVNKSVDVVFALDTTGSMKDDLEILQKELVPALVDELKNYSKVRLGLLLYRDYGDNYNYKNLPVLFFDFAENTDEFFKKLKSIEIKGNPGGDIPEAVYEALYAAINFYSWDWSSQRKIILIGDAQPHTRQRKKEHGKESVYGLAQVKDISIDTIITPDKKK